jgi:pyruvate/2-oxoglutarate dehydrogenase complex dihydrolipoamide acyltransferase (E2) component
LIEKGEITFIKKVGDSVSENDVVAMVWIKAPKAGVIEQLLFANGSKIMVDLPIIKLKACDDGVLTAPATKPVLVLTTLQQTELQDKDRPLTKSYAEYLFSWWGLYSLLCLHNLGFQILDKLKEYAQRIRSI